MSTISVVIPNYNRAALIGETLDNVLAQSRPPDEVIVVDDGSTDDSAAVVERFGERVTLIRQANRGPGAARNRGLAAARGDLIQFMDSDDLWSLNKLAAQERALRESGADFAYSPWLQARLEDGRALHAEPVLQQRALPANRSPAAWYLRGWVIVFQSCLFRRGLLDAVGPYREDLMPTEDSELLWRILRSGARPVHVPDALLLYRLHGGYQISQGGMDGGKRAADWLRYVAAVSERLDGAPGVMATDLRQWRRRAALAERAVEGADERSLVERASHLLDETADRVARKFAGSSWPTPFQAAPLTAGQAGLVQEIGYAPQRVPRAGL